MSRKRVGWLFPSAVSAVARLIPDSLPHHIESSFSIVWVVTTCQSRPRHVQKLMETRFIFICLLEINESNLLIQSTNYKNPAGCSWNPFLLFLISMSSIGWEILRGFFSVESAGFNCQTHIMQVWLEIVSSWTWCIINRCMTGISSWGMSYTDKHITSGPLHETIRRGACWNRRAVAGGFSGIDNGRFQLDVTAGQANDTT